MKTILHCIETSGPGGAENVLIRLTQEMADFGYKNLVLLLKDGWLADQLRRTDTDIHIHSGRTDPFSIGLAVHKLVASNSIDIIHAHEFLMNVSIGLYAAISPIPCVTTVHGKNYYGDKLRRRLLYRVTGRTTKLVAVSNDIFEHLNLTVGVPPTNVNLICNGIDVNQYQPSKTLRNTMRTQLNLQAKDTMILAVGNLYPVKGHEFLIEAFSTLKDNSSLKLFIAGRGKCEDSLRKLIQNSGLETQVTLLGFRNDIPDLLQACDIFCLPSLSEGLPLSILEAASAFKIVIASDVGGIGEVIDNDKTGKLVEPANPDSIALAIQDVIAKPEKTREMQENAFKLVSEKFDIRNMAKQYIELYR